MSALTDQFDLLENTISSGAKISAIRTQLSALREQAEAVEARVQQLETEVKNNDFTAERERLNSQLAEANREIEGLRSQVVSLGKQVTAEDGLEGGAVKFLQLLFEGDELSVEQIAASLGISKGMAEYHCGVLSQKRMIHPMSVGISTDFGDSPTTWIIVSEGREYLVKNKLVS